MLDIKTHRKMLLCENGQATIEAAIMIPVIFLLLLLLIQPAIILYDLIVMNEAACETCRVLSTCNSVEKESICDAFARRRLSAIPQQDNFHVHTNACSYEIELDGDHSSKKNSVTITNEVKPLPLIGFLSETLGLLNENKCFVVKAKSLQELKPSWVKNSAQGNNPDKWVGQWLNS